jgi:hypothetical protein
VVVDPLPCHETAGGRWAAGQVLVVDLLRCHGNAYKARRFGGSSGKARYDQDPKS